MVLKAQLDSGAAMWNEIPASAAVVVRWGDAVLEALDDPEKYHSEIAALPIAIANVICVELFDWQVRNGGFHQYFFNSYGITIDGAIRGFESMGLKQCASIARMARERLGGRFPEDRLMRIAQVGETLGQRLRFDDFDHAYFALDAPEIEGILDAYATAAVSGRPQ